MATPILPIAGVPDELIRVLNDRLRAIESAISGGSQAGPILAGSVKPNTVPKAGAGGNLTASSITDDGSQVAIDEGAAPQKSQLVLRANGQGCISALSYAAENQVIGFDADWQAGAWVARSTICAWIYKGYGGFLRILGSIGNTVGAAPATTGRAALNLSNGFFGVGGNLAPAYAIDATGDVNASGIHRCGGIGGIATAALPQVIPLAKLTSGGSNGSITVRGGIITGYSNPT